MLLHDLRYALRTMLRNRGFTAVALLSLALGIGANAAVFSLIDTVMLRPLPVRDPSTLVDLLHLYPTDPWLNGGTFDQYRYLRDHTKTLAALTVSAPTRIAVRSSAVDAERVAGNYFPMLGLKPAAGRLIDSADDGANVAVLSWPYWNSQFGLDPAAVGKQIVIDKMPFTIVGIAPKGFFGIVAEYRTRVWTPLSSHRIFLNLMGRLRPGVSISQAQGELAVLYRQSIDEATLRRDPNWKRVQFKLAPAAAGLSLGEPPWGRVRDLYDKPLMFLMAVVGLLLLIACSNLANMLLARGAAREPEMALRICLGASRWRLARQTLTESLLLSSTGALGGMALAYFGARGLARIMVSGRTRLALEVQLDLRVVLFLAAAGLVTGLLFGVTPAMRAMASAPATSLRAKGRVSGRSLVVAQVAIAAVLLSSAGLFLRHLSSLRNADLGFRRDHILIASLNPARSEYSPQQLSTAYRNLLDRLNALPGVRSATLSDASPISGAAASLFVTAEGYRPKSTEMRSFVNWVAPRYFETYGTPLLEGREFSLQDAGASHVAIVNRSTARYYFADADPLGRHITLDRDDQPFEIIGVVGDAKYLDLHEPAPRTVYLPAFSEKGVGAHRFAVRTGGEPAAMTGTLRQAVNAVLKDVPIENTTTLSAQMDASIVPERLTATLATIFGALGSLLAAIGVYGLLACTMARRTNEIGVRMALGATGSSVTRMVLSDALRMTIVGLAIGMPLAIWSRTFAASLIPGLPQTNPLTLLAGGAALIAVALAAAYPTARRASQVDPTEALRHE